MRLPAGSVIMRWIIEHVANTTNRSVLGPDGRTAYHHWHGKQFNGHVIEFGEKLTYFVLNRIRAKLDRKWEEGVYLGTSNVTREHFIWTSEGGMSAESEGSPGYPQSNDGCLPG